LVGLSLARLIRRRRRRLSRGDGADGIGNARPSLATGLLRAPARWWGYGLVISAGSLAMLIWSVPLGLAFQAIGIEVTPVLPPSIAQIWVESWLAFANLWPAAAVEELIFRMPLALAVAAGANGIVAPLTVVLSMLFGVLHGASLPHLLLQGGDGIFLSVVFLRCGGAYGDPGAGWAAATATHGLANSTLWLIAHFALFDL
jgi:hypothetical protein